MQEIANTKAAILSIALDLFSQKGYSSVSIRDICSKVGIKESSIYYHFKNKKEIFDDLCEHFKEITNQLSQNFDIKMSEATTITEEEFYSVCKNYLNHYLMDDNINKFIRMLIIEQSSNSQIAELYHMVLFDKAIAGQTVIFQWLIQIGFLKKTDLESLTMEYYAPILYYFHRYLVSEPITDEIRTNVNRKVMKHVKNFLIKYKKD